MERGRDPLSRAVAALCHLRPCLQGSMLAISKESAVTGGKSKTRKHASPFSYPLSIPFFSLHLFLPDLLFFFSSPFRSHLFLYQFYLVCRCHYARIHCVGASICLTCTERMYLGWAQPSALKGIVRVWHIKAHTYIVHSSSRDSEGQHILLPESETCWRIVYPGSVSSAILVIRDRREQHWSVCKTLLSCSLSLSLGLGKGVRKGGHAPIASTSFF